MTLRIDSSTLEILKNKVKEVFAIMIYKIVKGEIVETLTDEEFGKKYPKEELYTSGNFNDGFISSSKLAVVLGSSAPFNKNKELIELKRDLRNKEQELDTLAADYDLFKTRAKTQLSERDAEISTLNSNILVLKDDLGLATTKNEDLVKKLSELKAFVETVLKDIK